VLHSNIVAALEKIYEDSHELEAIGINKILMKPTTLFAIYLLDFVLLLVSKLSKMKIWMYLSSQVLLMPCYIL